MGKSDTAFPADATRDEEHPCLNGDGSVFGIDKAASPPTDNKHDIFLFDRSQSPPASIVLGAGANEADHEEQYCVLDSMGRYLGFIGTS